MKITDFIVFKDPKLVKKWSEDKVPMSELTEAYFDDRLDFKAELQDFLESKDDFVKYSIFTKKHLQFFFTRFLPEVVVHSQKQDIKISQEHYDRGNDFFGWFLGKGMVYTSAFFRSGEESLETGQEQKMELVCDKLKMSENDHYLDIGCGWGTLIKYAAENVGADATGITVAKEQVSFGNNCIKKAGLEDKARLFYLDYRDIPNQKFDKIPCLEMAEHVGVRRFKKFMKQIYDLLEEDGIFYLQIAGLRRGFHPEDLVWGLFMSKYIFPGADASMPISWVLDKLERVGFEIHSIENVGIHYSQTIQHWYDNWMKNKDEVVAAYGERWFRI